MGNQGCGHLCHVWSCHLHGLQIRGRGWSVGAAVTGGMNPATTAAGFPVAIGDAVTGRLESHVPFSAATGFSGAAGSSITERGWDHRHHLSCSPISTSSMCSSTTPTPIYDVQVCGSLWCPGVLGRETYVEFWKFY